MMPLRALLPGLLAGMVFGSGLALSDMVNPARVLAFLDVAGRWDPTLALVMAGALAPSALAYAAVRRMSGPLLEPRFDIPASRGIDARLLGGAAMFGAGWGLAGLCPGPAIAGLALGRWEMWLFAAAMIGGMLLAQAWPPGRRSVESRPKEHRPMTDESRLSTRAQIEVDEIAGLAADGFRMLINNRPDGEAPGQPSSAELEAEARRRGIGYRYIPVVPGQATSADAQAFAEAVAQADGPVVAFCRTGARAEALRKLAFGTD